MIVRIVHAENGARYDLELETLPAHGDLFTDSEGRPRIVRAVNAKLDPPGILVRLDKREEE